MLVLHAAPAPASAHYRVDLHGGVTRLAAEDQAVSHAGTAKWRGRGGIDARSVAIALVNPGTPFGFAEYPVLQLAATCDLCLEVMARHRIAQRNVVGHADIAPDRARDPGETFDWEGFARNGVGLWPEGVPDLGTGGAVRDAANLRDVRAALAAIGYDVAAEGALDPALSGVLRAFQRHWRPEEVTGQADAGTLARLLAVARMTALL